MISSNPNYSMVVTSPGPLWIACLFGGGLNGSQDRPLVLGFPKNTSTSGSELDDCLVIAAGDSRVRSGLCLYKGYGEVIKM